MEKKPFSMDGKQFAEHQWYRICNLIFFHRVKREIYVNICQLIILPQMLALLTMNRIKQEKKKIKTIVYQHTRVLLLSSKSESLCKWAKSIEWIAICYEKITLTLIRNVLIFHKIYQNSSIMYCVWFTITGIHYALVYVCVLFLIEIQLGFLKCVKWVKLNTN